MLLCHSNLHFYEYLLQQIVEQTDIMTVIVHHCCLSCLVVVLNFHHTHCEMTLDTHLVVRFMIKQQSHFLQVYYMTVY